MFCPNCGKEIANGAAFCTECGNPVAGVVGTTPEVAAPFVQEPQKKKTGLIICVAVIAALAVAGALFFAISLKNKAETKAYYENMKTVSFEMINGGAAAESMGNLVKSVWYNAIYEERDSATDKYTRPNGFFLDDFNDALSNLMSDPEYTERVASLEENQETVANLMKQLTNPPKEYTEAYAVLKDYYDSYLKLTKMAISPSGSLTTFSEGFNAADSELVNNYEKMQLYVK